MAAVVALRVAWGRTQHTLASVHLCVCVCGGYPAPLPNGPFVRRLNSSSVATKCVLYFFFALASTLSSSSLSLSLLTSINTHTHTHQQKSNGKSFRRTHTHTHVRTRIRSSRAKKYNKNDSDYFFFFRLLFLFLFCFCCLFTKNVRLKRQKRRHFSSKGGKATSGIPSVCRKRNKRENKRKSEEAEENVM